jgi:hypothetical protein
MSRRIAEPIRWRNAVCHGHSGDSRSAEFSVKESEMNTYPDYYDFDELDRRSRLQGSVAVGDAIGSMITATVFGLTRAVDEFNAGTGGSTVRESSDADSTPGSGAHR